LSDADLSCANLRGAYLSDAYLSDADLSCAYLSDADLSCADLSDADLSCANLRGADLSGANLRGADLSGADLSGAYLSDAYLSGAYLSDAYLSGADFSYNRYVIGCTLTNYTVVAFMHKNNLCFTSGCRLGLTLKEARTHWSPENKENWTKKESSWGEQRLRQIDFLEAEAKHLEWIK
jgi:hypothetical protein